MCGLAGIILGQRRRSRKELDQIGETFTRLLLLSEHRGPYATGAAWVKMGGTLRVVKHPLPARRFVETPDYLSMLNAIDQRVTVLLGHTRWPSRGSVVNPEENHPICTPPILLTHNGTIKEHTRQARRLGLSCTTKVDSELLARLAQRHTGEAGIDVDAFLAALAPLEGSMSAALIATHRPDEIVLLKGNMPLEVRIHRNRRLLLYASEPRIFDAAIGDEAGWEAIPVAPGEALVVSTAAIHAPCRLRFTFQEMAWQAARDGFTGA